MTCPECGEEIVDGENWACLKGFVPVAGCEGFHQWVHFHGHVKCLKGELKMKALRWLGQIARDTGAYAAHGMGLN